MRARHIILTIAAAVVLAAPTAVLAQTGPGPGDGSGSGGGWGGGFGSHGGDIGGFGGQGGGMLRMIPRILRHLDLEPGQQELIEGILETTRTTIEPLVKQSKEQRNAFHEIYGIGDFDDIAYREFFEALAAIDVEIKLASADAVSQVWKLLTPEQQQQIEDMRGSFGKGMARRGSGRRPTS